jgi:4'-phosphopantetheinyl transferase
MPMKRFSNPDLTLLPAEVHIFQISNQLSSAEKTRLCTFLSSEEEEVFSRCINPVERDFRRLLRGFLRDRLGKYCKTSPESLQFIISGHGKPALAPQCCHSPIQFNLSHSGDQAVLAVTMGTGVGIDIEKIKPRKHIQDIAARFFTCDERKFLSAGEDDTEKTRRFYYLWTRKEAVVKAMGESLAPWLQKISALPDTPAGKWRPVTTSLLSTASLCSFDAAPGYMGALCVEGQPGSLVFR